MASYAIGARVFGLMNRFSKPLSTNNIKVFTFNSQPYATSSRADDHLPLSKKNSDDLNLKESSPKITLIGTDNNLTITSLQEAQKQSQRKDLKLVKMLDFEAKTHRAVYKLMTGAEFFEEDKKQRQIKQAKRENMKREKLVSLSYKISNHDLESRLKIIGKWLIKNYEARIVISGEADNPTSAEKIYKIMENALKEQGNIVQKRLKGNEIRFQVLPSKKVTKMVDENTTNTSTASPTS